MAAPFRLVAGDSAPVQQSPTTCGSASLTVARMLADPAFATWISSGVGARAVRGRMPAPGTEATRFAAYEQVVAARTNGLVGPGGRLQLPWPRALGTPPWGARRELELSTGEPMADYVLRWTRFRRPAQRSATYRVLREHARDGRPGLLYIGNRWAPRHVVLVLSGGEGGLEVYEPFSGEVRALTEDRFVGERVGLAGWNTPWVAICATS